VHQTSVSYLKTSQHTFEITTLNEAVKAIKFVSEIEYQPTLASKPPILTETKSQLLEYLEGKRTEFTVRLEPEGTDFQRKVWAKLRHIPYGKTFTYSQMAAQLGDPKVIRAAASANGKNPIAIMIPCHRVIGNDGSLTGYAGGLSNKRFLLDLENKIANGVQKLF
jgi:methylated-DNA-[protein]-cysteine S-methyltransferase